MENNKDLENFIAHSYEMFGYWADVRIDVIINRKHSDSETEEFRALKTLVSTDAGKQALRKLWVDCGRSNIHSTLTYIDGCTGVKPLEIVSTHTGEPIAEGMLHEHLSPVAWGDKWEEISNSQRKSKRLKKRIWLKTTIFASKTAMLL